MTQIEVREAQASDHVLREKAREAIRAGQLPARLPDNLFGGLSTRTACAICGEMTLPGSVELELEFLDEADGTRRSFRAHPRCFSMFKLELTRP